MKTNNPINPLLFDLPNKKNLSGKIDIFPER